MPIDRSSTSPRLLRSVSLTLVLGLAGACAAGEIGGPTSFGPAPGAGGGGDDDDEDDGVVTGGPIDDDGGPGGLPDDGPDPDDAGDPGDGDDGADGKGDCCVGNGSPGCDDATIEMCVCAQDDFCCINVWDDICAGMVTDLGCAPCGPPGDDDDDDMADAGDGGGGTDGGDAGDGGDMGGGDMGGVDPQCPIGFGDCCAANGSIGCNDCEIETCVCDVDSYCCDTDWDDICVDEAATECGACGGGGGETGVDPSGGETGVDPSAGGESTGTADAGDCCDPDNGTPGCDDAAVEACTCALDSFCCDVEWDGICVDQATADCNACGGAGGTTDGGVTSVGSTTSPGGESTSGPPPTTGGAGVGNCCEEHGGTGCSIAEIETCVCGADAFCCDVEWDGLCVLAVDDCAGFACP